MGNNTILVIEDDKLNMKLVKKLLHIGKYDVLLATDAEKGLQVAREHHPGLILMDIQLPGMDGLSATRLIKHDRSLVDIPVVGLTAFAMRGDEEKGLDSGLDGYITKPINTREFLDIIKQFIKGNRTGDPTAELS